MGPDPCLRVGRQPWLVEHLDVHQQGPDRGGRLKAESCPWRTVAAASCSAAEPILVGGVADVAAVTDGGPGESRRRGRCECRCRRTTTWRSRRPCRSSPTCRRWPNTATPTTDPATG